MSHEMDRRRKKMRIRKKVAGSTGRPRLAVFRSLKHIYAQIIDDEKGTTIVAVSSLTKEITDASKEKSKRDVAFEVGKLLADRCKKAGIQSIVFDRGGYVYHGRVARVADGAREGGLNF